MKKIFPGLLLSLLFPAMLAAENTEESPRKPLSDANITGHVQDAATGEHLPYITVVVKGTTIGTATDGTGHYFLKNLPAGEFVLEASMLGYGTVEKRVTTTSGKTIEVNFVLTEDSERMDEIVVTANRNETNKKESSTIVNITSGKLFSAVGSSTLSESMNFTPGLRIENNCGNCAVTQLRINGLEGHYSQILLDSRPIFSSLATVYGLDQLPVSMIERGRLGPLRSQRHRRRRKHHHQGAPLQHPERLQHHECLRQRQTRHQHFHRRRIRLRRPQSRHVYLRHGEGTLALRP